MSKHIVMPTLSPTMTSGILSRWNVTVGDKVNVGDIVAEIETDKVTVELEAETSGFIQALMVEAGQDNVDVGSVIAQISESDDQSPLNKLAGEQNESSIEKLSTPQTIAKDSTSTFSAKDGLIERSNESSKSLSANQLLMNDVGANVRASPLARRMAAQKDIDLSTIKGSGAKGRVTKEDILLHLGMKPAANETIYRHTEKVQFDIPYAYLPDFQEQNVSSMRTVVAERLTSSSREIPHFYMTVECIMDELLVFRERINESLPREKKVSVNDFVLKAVALAFTRIPEANVMWAGDKILAFEQVDIAMAVALKDGLITPVIPNCESKSVGAISKESKLLVEKAKSGQLKQEEYQGGTFTVSNLGMYGIKEFTSIINPPQCGILSVGSAQKCAIVVDESIKIATKMSVTLAMDHRCVDGVVGAKLIKMFQSIIEKPIEFLL